MRIAIFYNLPSGGGKRSLYEWTRRLADKHTLEVFTYSSADHNFCDIRPFVQRYQVYPFTSRRLYASPFGRLNQLQRWRDLSSLSGVGNYLARDINAGEYDIVFTQPCIYTFIPTFIHSLRVPASYYLHEPFGKNYNRQLKRPYLKRNKRQSQLDRVDPLIALYRYHLEQLRVHNMKHITQLLANSRFTQEYISQEYGRKAEIIHYGVDNQVFRPLLGVEKEQHILSVGQLTPRKGFDFLVQSISKVPVKKRPMLRLICNVSNTPEDLYIHTMEQNYLCGMADRLGVNIQILTNLNTEGLLFQYNQAMLCIYAPVQEPFGLVPLEAMACGTPVIGVREGGVQETIIHEHNGLLVDRDPLKFALAIQSLMEDPDHIQQLGQQAREYVLDHWTWDRSVIALEEHLKDCSERSL